jgi:spore coat polysaccharide biosynthesis protein SpsF
MVTNPYIIIQARMNSERLPGKVMMPASGKPLIGILIDRLKSAGIPVLLATSKNPENDPLDEYAESIGIEVFRGSEDNVLERYYLAAKSVEADLIFRLTGDNPFVDGSIIKEVFNLYAEKGSQRTYISTGLSKTWPLGISAEAFSFALLEEAYSKAALPGESEHVTPYMHQNFPGDIVLVSYAHPDNKYHYRLSVDTVDDFKLFKILVEEYQAESKTIQEIIQVLDKYPELKKINSGVIQKEWK